MIRDVLEYGANEALLRRRSAEVLTEAGHEAKGKIQARNGWPIGTARLIDDMIETMHAAKGIGLAAPQLGELLRLVVIDMPAIAVMSHPDLELLGDQPSETGMVLANPVIVARSTATREGREACLSVDGYEAAVARAARVTVRALDRNAMPFTLEAEGVLAACLQHEIDHLDGVLFVDRLGRMGKELALRALERRRRGGAPARKGQGAQSPVYVRPHRAFGR